MARIYSLHQRRDSAHAMDLDLQNLPDMEYKLMELVRQVPNGRVTTYGRLAEALGDPVAARWVGHFLRHHTHEPTCLCHRVVRAGGELGGFVTGNIDEKARLLRADEIEVAADSVDLDRYGFSDFAGEQPLDQLRDFQSQLKNELLLSYDGTSPKLIAGVDVSYSANGDGVAAYALVDASSHDLVWSTTIRDAVRFPYITSYLAFRELPLLVQLLNEAVGLSPPADVVIVDGSGVMHPRGAGIASQLGIVANIPTIGVTKKLLCGHVDLREMQPGEMRPVVMDGDRVGVALRHRQTSKRPLFISPGHRIDVDTAAQLVCHLSESRPLPEPIYWADRLSRREAKTAK